MDHFSQEHIPFFDQVTMKRMKDADLSVLYRVKTITLSEFFALELKFTIDTLIKSLNTTFKQKFLEPSDFQKQAFVEKNSIGISGKVCSICGFMLSLSARERPEWTLNLTTRDDFIVQQEYHFLKNIYDPKDVKKMESLKTLEDFYDMFEYVSEVVVLLKDENYVRSNDSEKVEKIKEFFATYCSDCNNSSKIIELIDDFKIVQKYNGGYKNKNNKFYKLIAFA